MPDDDSVQHDLGKLTGRVGVIESKLDDAREAIKEMKADAKADRKSSKTTLWAVILAIFSMAGNAVLQLLSGGSGGGH